MVSLLLISTDFYNENNKYMSVLLLLHIDIFIKLEINLNVSHIHLETGTIFYYSIFVEFETW